jgi:SAM-dependent methyltransferase
MTSSPALERFLSALRTSVEQGVLVKLTLGKYRGPDAALKNLFVRPVSLKSGPHLSFVYRYTTRDETKNFPPAQALEQLVPLIGHTFRDAHLFTPVQTLQLATADDGTTRVHAQLAAAAPGPAPGGHDRTREHLIPPTAPWLNALGVMNERALAREGMAPKFRQINRFVELVSHLTDEANLPSERAFRVADMGCGKGYLTFAVASHFGARAEVLGVEARPELVQLCNRVAREQGMANLRFQAGAIVDAPSADLDVLIALHACDTATDDALARGIQAGARLLVVSPCCQKELRRQLTAPAVLGDALKHGIFQERQAEFVTDALRAQLLEWAGYRTKVFEFVSTEHTAKNLMIAAIRSDAPNTLVPAARVRAFAAFYGIRHQQLATHLGFDLVG